MNGVFVEIVSHLDLCASASSFVLNERVHAFFPAATKTFHLFPFLVIVFLKLSLVSLFLTALTGAFLSNAVLDVPLLLKKLLSFLPTVTALRGACLSNAVAGRPLFILDVIVDCILSHLDLYASASASILNFLAHVFLFCSKIVDVL